MQDRVQLVHQQSPNLGCCIVVPASNLRAMASSLRAGSDTSKEQDPASANPDFRISERLTDEDLGIPDPVLVHWPLEDLTLPGQIFTTEPILNGLDWLKFSIRTGDVCVFLCFVRPSLGNRNQQRLTNTAGYIYIYFGRLMLFCPSR